MTRATLLHVLERPTALGPAEVRELEQLAQAFPYCQTAHLLLAKAAHDQGTMLAGQRLRRAATYAADRTLLRRLIEQEEPVEQAAAPEPAPLPPAPHPLDLVDWPDEYVPPTAAPPTGPARFVPAPSPAPVAPAPVAESAASLPAEPAGEVSLAAAAPVVPVADEIQPASTSPEPTQTAAALTPESPAATEALPVVSTAATVPVEVAPDTTAEAPAVTEQLPAETSPAATVQALSASPGADPAETSEPVAELADTVAELAAAVATAPTVLVPTHAPDIAEAPPRLVVPAATEPAETAASAASEPEPVAAASAAAAPPEAELPPQAPAIRPPVEAGEARFEFGLADPAPAVAAPAYELPGLVDEWAASAVTRSLGSPDALVPAAPALPEPVFTPAAFTGDAVVGYAFGESSRLGLSMQLLDLLAAKAEAAESATAVVAAAQPPATPLPPAGTFFEPDPLLLDHWATHRPAPSELPSTVDLINNFLKRQPRLTRPAMLPPAPGGQADLSVRSTRAEPDLVSENLARIFVRQGKTARAIEIYEKLMVKQPEKMAYFALQIQSLQPSA